jgi:DNA polymerase I-like protein with 3'-5' exonuclease and polymerase domains
MSSATTSRWGAQTRPQPRRDASDAATAALPLLFKGEYREVAAFTDAERRAAGLSTRDTVIQITTDEGLRDVLAYARAKGKVGIDSETGGAEGTDDALNPWLGTLELLQVGDSERQYVIWCRYITDWAPIHEMLSDRKIVKIGQNLKFDIRFWLVKMGLQHRWWNIADAGIVEQVIGCGLFSESDEKVGMTLKMTSMDNMARRWLGLVLPKDAALRTGWANYTPETLPLEKLLYAADDVCVPAMLLARQRGWVKRLGLVDTVNLEHAYLPVLADMEVRGIKLDLDQWLALAEEAEGQVREAIRALDRLFDVTVTVEIDQQGRATFTRDKNYASKDQLRDLLRAYMKEHHDVEVIAANQHFKDALIAHGFNPLRAEKLFAQTKVPTGKFTKTGKPAMEKRGAPMMTDHCEAHWEEYRRYLPKTAIYLPDTKSGTFRLNKIIHAAEGANLDAALPNRVGLPAALVDPILASRKYAKSAGTYGRNWIAHVQAQTGRVHVDFTQTALATGRISAKPNTQNPPGSQKYRDCFIAEGEAHPVEPSCFIGADWDQIEPRIIAQLSNCFTYKRVFFSKHAERPEFKVYCQGVTEALDLYTEIGKMIGVIPEWMTVLDTKGAEGHEPNKDGKKGRKQAKIVVLGLGYGTGKGKFFITLVLDLGEAQWKDYADELYDRFWTAVPEVKKTLDHFSNLAYPGDEVMKGGRVTRKKSPRRIWHPFANGEVTWAETIGGRKRFYRKESFSWWTTGRNMPIQGTGADIMKRAMVKFAWWMWEHCDAAFGFVNSIHDEVIVEVPVRMAAECYQVLCDIMQRVGETYCKDVPITSAGYTSNRWIKD